MLGIIGLGNIGQELARISMILGMTVLAYGPRPSRPPRLLKGLLQLPWTTS